jgi:hypothetical protein
MSITVSVNVPTLQPTAAYRLCVGCGPTKLYDEETMALCPICDVHFCPQHVCSCAVIEDEEAV